jgi:hypothetical protein
MRTWRKYRNPPAYSDCTSSARGHQQLGHPGNFRRLISNRANCIPSAPLPAVFLVLLVLAFRKRPPFNSFSTPNSSLTPQILHLTPRLINMYFAPVAILVSSLLCAVPLEVHARSISTRATVCNGYSEVCDPLMRRLPSSYNSPISLALLQNSW